MEVKLLVSHCTGVDPDRCAKLPLGRECRECDSCVSPKKKP